MKAGYRYINFRGGSGMAVFCGETMVCTRMVPYFYNSNSAMVTGTLHQGSFWIYVVVGPLVPFGGLTSVSDT